MRGEKEPALENKGKESMQRPGSGNELGVPEKPGEASMPGAEARAKDAGGEVGRRAEPGEEGVYKPGEGCGFYS